MATWPVGCICFPLTHCRGPEHQAASLRLKLLNICWSDTKKRLQCFCPRTENTCGVTAPAYYWRITLDEATGCRQVRWPGTHRSINAEIWEQCNNSTGDKKPGCKQARGVTPLGLHANLHNNVVIKHLFLNFNAELPSKGQEDSCVLLFIFSGTMSHLFKSHHLHLRRMKSHRLRLRSYASVAPCCPVQLQSLSTCQVAKRSSLLIGC